VYTAYSDLQGGMNAGCGYDEVVVTDLRTEGAPEFTSQAGGFPFVGTDSAQSLPFQTAAVTTWRTALRGRSFRGRTYLGGFTEAFSDGRNPSSTLLTAINEWRDDMLEINDTMGGGIGVISRRHNKGVRLIGVVNQITSGDVATFWATQRRRAGRDRAA
jgi:hypothetical protein